MRRFPPFAPLPLFNDRVMAARPLGRGGASLAPVRGRRRRRRGLLCRGGECGARVVAREVVALDTLLEFAERANAKALGGGGLFDAQAVVTLHRAVDGDVFDLLGETFLSEVALSPGSSSSPWAI